MRAAILLSGGIDSAALAFWKRPSLAISVDYGQAPSESEIRAASIIAVELAMQHEVVRVDLRDFGSGSMARRTQLPVAPTPEWWPFRNQLLITLGAMVCIRETCDELLVGTVLSDNLHSDGSRAFVHRIDELVSGQEGGIRIHAPAAQIESAQLVALSGISRSSLAWCHSCHRGNIACGECRGCQKNREVRNAVGLRT